MFMQDSYNRRKFITSIPDKYHVMMVKYYFSSVAYIAKPMHYDALTILIEMYDENYLTLNQLTSSVCFLDERICDLIIRDKEHLGYSAYRVSHKINAPISKHREMIMKFPNAIYAINNLSDEMKEYHSFIHEL